jgi:Zn-dependent protease/predicted transcriptional regulator
MKWAVKVGRIAGIDVQIHVTFLILVAFVVFQHYQPRGDWGDVLAGLLLTAALFGIVVLHELGHALAARRYGIRTRDITLLPIGGVARLERMPEDPRQELVVALAGPAVNVALAALLAAFLVPAAALSSLLDFQLVGGSFLGALLLANVVMALFNLIPAFPMDGGRVLRALLALKMEYVAATNVAATVGQAAALLFGFWGLMQGPPFLIFIALFVWIAASQEASMVQMRSALGGIPVARAMITDYETLRPSDSLARAVDHTLAGFQQDFPVLDEEGRVVGILTRGRLMAALAQGGDQRSVHEVMEREFLTTDPYEMADRAFARLAECQCRALPVTFNGRLVGLLTPENVGEFLMIQAALHDAARARPEPRRGHAAAPAQRDS